MTLVYGSIINSIAICLQSGCALVNVRHLYDCIRHGRVLLKCDSGIITIIVHIAMLLVANCIEVACIQCNDAYVRNHE